MWRWFETIDTNCLANPAVRGIITNARDVTERKAAEAELIERSRAKADLLRVEHAVPIPVDVTRGGGGRLFTAGIEVVLISVLHRGREEQLGGQVLQQRSGVALLLLEGAELAGLERTAGRELGRR